MIGRQIKGRGFRGLLAYLHGKPDAERIAGNLDGVLPREMAREFAEVRQLRPRVSRAVFHMPVRPAPGETLSVEQWREVAERIAFGMGFGDSPWVAYLHRDAREEHLHLVASRVGYDGRVVSDAHDYRRGMRVLREIERDFGLSLGPPERVDRKPPAQAEKQGVPEGTSVRLWLQERIARAAEGGPRIGTFLDRLERAGVEVLPSIDARGQVRGISYRAQGLAFPGSSLGLAYSFPGLQRRLGVRFDARHDLPLLFALRERASARSASPQEALSMSGPQPVSEAPSPAAPITLGTIRRQLRAIGAERYDVLLVDPANGEREIRARWTLNDIERSLGWLRHRNAQGAEILVRPSGDSPSVLVAEVPKAKVGELGKRDLEPAAVVELAGGTSEVWLRHPEVLKREEADVVAALLSREIRGGRTPSEPERWGHLAGFTTPLADREREGLAGGRDAEEPLVYAQLRRGSGTVYDRSEEIREEAGALLLERRNPREIAPTRGGSVRQELDTALERGARDPWVGVGVREVSAPFDLERQHGDWVAARDRFLELRAEPVPVSASELLRREIDVVEAYRRLGELEKGLEEATGLRPFPGQLAPSDLGQAAEISERWSQAVRDADFAGDRALLSPRAELDAIRIERESILGARAEEAFSFGADRGVRLDPTPGEALAEAALAERPIGPAEIEARAERLREAVEHLGADPGPVETTALREAFAGKIEAELSVEAVRADLSRATRALTLESDDLAGRLERFERLLGPEHSPAARVQYGEILERFERVDSTLHQLRERLGEVELASIDRALDRVGLGLGGGEKTVWETSTEPFRRYAERLEERGELAERVAGRDPELGREIRPVESAELSQARGDLSREASRVVEDRTPEALAGYRAAAERVGGLESVGRDRSAEVEFSGARRELRLALRDLRADPSGQLPAPAVERFRGALDRFHAAEERFASRLPAPRADLSSEEKFGALLGRVRRGDHTPETLSQLHRAVVLEIRGATGRVPQAELPPPSRRDLLDGLDRYRQARVELSWEIHRHGTSLARRDPAALERLQPILARYQVAARDLERTTERFVRNPQSQVLPVRFFLRHPEYKGAPHRALAAWARHAADRGRTAPQLRAHLARAVPRSQLARSSVLSRPWIGRAAFYGVRWAGRTLHRLVREEARSR